VIDPHQNQITRADLAGCFKMDLEIAIGSTATHIVPPGWVIVTVRRALDKNSLDGS
jgi:hypothetical protein